MDGWMESGVFSASNRRRQTKHLPDSQAMSYRQWATVYLSFPPMDSPITLMDARNISHSRASLLVLERSHVTRLLPSLQPSVEGLGSQLGPRHGEDGPAERVEVHPPGERHCREDVVDAGDEGDEDGEGRRGAACDVQPLVAVEDGEDGQPRPDRVATRNLAEHRREERDRPGALRAAHHTRVHGVVVEFLGREVLRLGPLAGLAGLVVVVVERLAV
mmetsp:Transcript_51144/g.128403  ORF Transcript_51144/g.128403 Transcript_51144/m.128403 type:complete len:217 (-) Transcript_51144:3562-4212(-)